MVDLPARVHVDVELRISGKLRDDENVWMGVKWICDTLKAVQTGRLLWRQNAYDEKGYFIDDSPDHRTMTVHQTRVPHRPDQCAIVTITPRE